MLKRDIQQTLLNIINRGDERDLKVLWKAARKFNLVKGSDLNDSQKNDTLYRLIYSSARSEDCTEEDISEILTKSRINNKPRNITGLLIYTEKRFLQVLEGRYEDVKSLYDKINDDPRHGGSYMRYCEPASQRFFTDWNMAEKKLQNEKLDFKSGLSDNEASIYQALVAGKLHNYSDEGIRSIKSFLSIA